MKAFTKLGLSIGLVVAAIGAAPASAFGTTITSGGSPYNGPFEIDELASDLLVLDNGVYTRCTTSEPSGTIAADGTGQITSWSIAGCSYYNTLGFPTPISWTPQGLPYDIEVEHTSGSDGTLTITSPFTLRANQWDCTVTAAAGAVAAEVTGASPFGGNAGVFLSEQPLSAFPEEGFCGNSATWSAEFEFLTPDQLRVEP